MSEPIGRSDVFPALSLRAVRGQTGQAGASGMAAGVRLAGRDAPPNLALLFPGLRFGVPGAALIGITSSHFETRHWETRRWRSARHPALWLQPGPLQTPRFSPGLPWLSGTVAGGSAPGRPIRPIPAAAEEALLRSPMDDALLRRAAAAARRLVSGRLGGAAWADPAGSTLLRQDRLVLLRVGEPAAGRAALDGILARHDAARTVILLPEGAAVPAWAAGCVSVREPVDPWSLLARCAEVHVCGGDGIGFLALLAGVPVHCHAPGWYAGWGPTTDAAVPARGDVRSVEHIAAAGLLLGTRYADPFTGRPSSCEAALDLAAEWRRTGQANRGVTAFTGTQFWKRRRIAQFLHTGVRAPAFRRGAAEAVAAAREGGGAVASWSSRMPAGLQDLAAAAGVPVLRVEDGFIRSVGLGSDFLPPCSVIMDGAGIYYDPRQPSDLEALLAGAQFDPPLLDRAQRLIEQLVRSGTTKYGTGGTGPTLPPVPPGGRLLLVPGQVADDLSVRLGGAGIRSNGELLRRVRADNPGATILYKPHPDVDAGHRPGAIPDAEALRLADQVIRGGSMAALIDAVDEVHTLTSLAGFEALLRGRHVTTWGQPFYSGWGLTRDMAPLPRRQRQLSLQELAACVLLLYPKYVDPVTGMPCPVEVLMERLADARLWRPSTLVRLRRLQGRIVKRVERWGHRAAAAGNRRQA